MRILLVDPSRVVQRAIVRLIEQDQHEVIAFADGREALARLTLDHEVRCLITSTQPLGISGTELCAAVRDLSGARRAVHIVMMSSTDDLHLMVEALDRGADDFIRKPPISDELRARLRLADRVTSMKQRLIRYAMTDGLTGLLNRRAFFEKADLMCRTARTGGSLSAIIFDIDHFKRINDQYGHEVGDRVLQAVGVALRTVCHSGARLGGEEFGVLVTGETADALDAAIALQRSIRTLRLDHDGKRFSITCSFGIAQWEPGDTIDRIMRRADMAMYEAKKSGRDQIVVADAFQLTSEHHLVGGSGASQRVHLDDLPSPKQERHSFV